MSRIIVKNLPKHLKEDRLKEHFSKTGTITDVKLMKRSDGVSRKFAYIGYKTEKEAKASVRYFNDTFLDTSKLIVEVAKPVGDASLPKPWSKISLERLEARKKAEEQVQTNIPNQDEIDQQKDLLKTQHLKTLETINKDKKLQEFLEAYQTQSKAKIWANEDPLLENAIQGTKASKVKPKAKVVAVKNKKAGGEGMMLAKTHITFDEEEEEEDLYETLPKKEISEDSNEEVEVSDETPKNTIVNDEKVSDLDYLKSKMKASFEEESEYTEGPTQELVPNENGPSPNEEDLPNPPSPKLSPESQIMDNGRLFLRNLSYTCTEDEIRKLCQKYGALSEVHMPISKDTKKPKGFAFVAFLLPEHALKAYKALDNSFFQGRLLHVLPSNDPKPTDTLETDFENASISLKKKRQLLKKTQSTSAHNWSALFMAQDAIADAVAERLGITKGEVMDPTHDGLAARLATAETQLILEIQEFFKKHGLDFSGSEANKNNERSDVVIIVKNIPYGTTEEQLRQLFGKHGALGRVLIPPSKTIAVVEFLYPQEARSAFRHLAYKRFGDAPLYLEKAPKHIFKEANHSKDTKDGESANSQEATIKNETKSQPNKVETKLIIDNIFESESMDSAQGSTLFVKNLNFDTKQEDLHNAFSSLEGFRSAMIRMRPNPKDKQNSNSKPLSMGFGFVEFSNPQLATQALKTMQGYTLDGHQLFLKISDRLNTNKKKEGDESNQTSNKKQSTKLLIKNIPFEATKKDLRSLFSTFAEIKSLRLPTKFSGGHRGFAFIELMSLNDTKKVMENMQHTHLYGRHLVVEYAEEEDQVDQLRNKVKKQFNSEKEISRKKVKLDDEDEEEEKFY